MSNKSIQDDINKWTIISNPYGFSDSVKWLSEAEKVEDILQLEHNNTNGLILDVGFYNEEYKVFIIKDWNWEKPIECFSSKLINEVTEKVYFFINKYKNGL